MINWKKLRSNIPNKVKTSARTHYEVFWSEDFHFERDGEKTFGITRFDPKQIVINKNQGDKEAVLTYFHEYIHALMETIEINLTENEVRKLEKAYPRIREFVLTLEGKK